MMYSKNELREILIANGYPSDNESLLLSVINQIENFSDKAELAFSEWVKYKTRISFEINEITSDFLRNVRRQNEIAILLSYDHLLKEKETGSTEFSNKLKERRR